MVGATEICTQCNQGKVPIDGTCTAVDDTSKAKCKKDATTDLESNAQVCGACGAGYFLHKGGCYQFGGEVGKLICADPSTSDGSPAAGACTACAPGYFKNPTAVSAAVPPCIAYNDTTGFTDSTGSNTYKGVQNCEVCSPPTTPTGARADKAAVCTKCGSSKYLKDGMCVDNCASGAEFPKEDTNNGNRCVPCGDKIDGIADCQTCSKSEETVTCSACNNDKKPTTAGTACVACSIANCASCNEENVCEVCTNSKKLSPLKDACLTTCPAGTYDDNSICKPCHVSWQSAAATPIRTPAPPATPGTC